MVFGRCCPLQAMRLFVGEPVWTPYNRGPSTDAMPARQQYVQACGIKAH